MQEFVTFIAVINVATAVATFFTAYVCYVLGMQWMMSQYYTGFLGVFGALTVALKQAKPEEELMMSFISLKVKHIPFLLVVSGVCVDFIVRNGPHAQAIATPEGLAPAGSQCPYLLYGMLFGWFYLRYYQVAEGWLGVYGLDKGFGSD